MTRIFGPDQSGVRLIASDLDGTVLSHDFTISERTVAAFGAARDAGYEVVFVTGRPPWFMGPLARHMGQTGHSIGRVIGCNGAVVYDLDNEQILEADLLPSSVAADAVAGIRARVPHAVFGADTVAGPVAEEAFTTAKFPGYTIVDSLEEFLRNPPQEGPFAGNVSGVLKLYARDAESTDADGFAALAEGGVPEEAQSTHSLADVALVEISRKGVTKAKTLAAYAAELGIEPQETVAFGDMPNDIQMLEWAGVGYAMASGHPRAHAAADRLAPAFEDDGVARVLESLLATGTLPEGILDEESVR